MSKSLSNTMSNAITSSSTKSEIIDAATELISMQEDDINTKAKLLLAEREEKQALTYLLIASAIFGVLF